MRTDCLADVLRQGLGDDHPAGLPAEVALQAASPERSARRWQCTTRGETMRPCRRDDGGFHAIEGDLRHRGSLENPRPARRRGRGEPEEQAVGIARAPTATAGRLRRFRARRTCAAERPEPGRLEARRGALPLLLSVAGPPAGDHAHRVEDLEVRLDSQPPDRSRPGRVTPCARARRAPAPSRGPTRPGGRGTTARFAGTDPVDRPLPPLPEPIGLEQHAPCMPAAARHRPSSHRLSPPPMMTSGASSRPGTAGGRALLLGNSVNPRRHPVTGAARGNITGKGLGESRTGAAAAAAGTGSRPRREPRGAADREGLAGGIVRTVAKRLGATRSGLSRSPFVAPNQRSPLPPK